MFLHRVSVLRSDKAQHYSTSANSSMLVAKLYGSENVSSHALFLFPHQSFTAPLPRPQVNFLLVVAIAFNMCNPATMLEQDRGSKYYFYLAK